MKDLKYFLLLIGGWVLAYLSSDHDLTSVSTEAERMDSEMYFMMIVFTTIFLGTVFIRHDRKKGA
jgi:Na+/glutamate symporter